MSRCVLALFALGLALAPMRAADPKPLWEIDTVVDAKRLHSVRWVGISPDGKMLVAQVEDRVLGDHKERLVAWDLATRKEKFSVALTARATLDAGRRGSALTSAGTVLVAAGAPKEVRMTDGKVVSSDQIIGPAGAVWAAPDNPNAVWLVGDGEADSLAVGPMPGFEAEPRKGAARWPATPIRTSAGRLELHAVTVSTDATRIALAGRKGDADPQQLHLFTIGVAESVKLTEVATVPREHKGKISVLQFSPDCRTLATGSGDSTVFLWDVDKAGKEWKPRAMIAAGNFTVSALAFSPDGRTLAAGTFDEKGRPNLYLIDVPAGKLLASYRLPAAVMSVAYSPDGKVMVTGDGRGGIKAWNAEALRNPD